VKSFGLSREKLRSPLARRLIVAIILVSSTITLCLSALQLYGEYRSELGGIQTVFRQIEQVHMKSLSQSLWDTDAAAVQLEIEGMVRVPNIEYVAVREGDRIWAQAGRRTSGNIFERQYPITYVYRGRTLEIGTLTVVASLDAVYRGLVDRAFIILASNAFKTFLVAAFAFAFVHWLVTRHLVSIAGYLRGVDLRGRAPSLTLARAASRRPDELDEVTAAINLMHENARSLLTELQHETELAQLLEQLARAANGAVSPEAAMEICLRRICEEGKWVLGRVATFPPGQAPRKPDRSQWFCAEPARFDAFMRYSDGYEFMGGPSVFINRVLRDQRPIWLPDVTAFDPAEFARLAMASEAGLKAAFAFPVIVGGEVAAILEFFATETRQPDALLMDGTSSLASQIARLIERNRATEAQARLAAIVDNSSDAIIGRALDGTVISWNAAAERIFGYTAAEVIGRDPVEIIPPERRQETAERRNLTRSGEAVPNIETVRSAKDGRRIDVAVSFAAIRNRSGLIIGTSAIVRDITERKQVEMALRKNYELLNRIFETTHFCLVYLDRDINFVRVNQAYADACGHPPEFFPGKNHFELYPGEKVEAIFRRSIATGEPFSIYANPFEFPDHPEWGITYWDWTLHPLKSAGGDVEGLLFALLDVTERKRDENALRSYAARLRELSHRLQEVEATERNAISRELHDRIGQGLTTLSLMVGTLGTRLPEGARRAVQTQLEDMHALLRSVVANVRDVMAELRPPALDDYGLFVALRHLVTEFAKRTGIAVNLSGVDLNPRLPLIVETAMYRISQEALNNIAKHAHAKKVEISLDTMPERIALEIADDGIGFDTSDTEDGGEHWGMTTMRERAEAVGITFRLKLAPGAGTRIVLEVERAAT